MNRWLAHRLNRHVAKHGVADAAYARRVTEQRRRWLRLMYLVIPFLIGIDAFQWVLYVQRPSTGGLVWAILNTELLVFAAFTWRHEARSFHRMIASIDRLEVNRMEFREMLASRGVPIEQAELVDRLVVCGRYDEAWRVMAQFGLTPERPDEPE